MTSETEEAVARDIAGETLHGFRVAAWRETHPEHGDKYGHLYSEHWSTPNNRNPAVKVERLFTEDQFRTILTALERAERERDEALREMGRYAAEAGEAKGRLEMSEAAGIVDMWREHAKSAEAELASLKAEVVEVVEEAKAVVSSYRANTPLGHQPHMLGARADKLLPPLRDLLAKLKGEAR